MIQRQAGHLAVDPHDAVGEGAVAGRWRHGGHARPGRPGGGRGPAHLRLGSRAMTGEFRRRAPGWPLARGPDQPSGAARAGCSPGSATVGFLVTALVVSAYLGATFGVQTALLALAVATLPLGIVIPAFLWLDRFESEPTRYLVVAFLWGALVAAVVAAVFNTSAIAVLEVASDPDAASRRRPWWWRPWWRRLPRGPGAPRLVGPAARVRRRHRRDGLRGGHGRGLRLHREHPVPGAGLHRRRGRGADRHLRRPLPALAVRAPDVHGAHRGRRRHRRDLAHLAAARRRPGRRLPTRRARSRAVEPRRGHRRLRAARRLPPRRGAGLPRVRRLRRVGAAARGPAHRPVPPAVRRRGVARPGGGGDALVDAAPPGGPGVGARQRGSARPGRDAGVPGHRLRAGHAAAPDAPRRGRLPGPGPGAGAAPALAGRREEFVGMPVG